MTSFTNTNKKEILFGRWIPLSLYLGVCQLLDIDPRVDTDEKPDKITTEDFLGLNEEIRSRFIAQMGVDKIIKKLDAEQVDKQTVKRTAKYYDEHKKEYVEKEYDDTYTLYKIPASSELAFVHCHDVSTNREYFIPVRMMWFQKNVIQAIASTFYVPINAEEVYQQGDLIISKVPDFNKPVRQMSEQEYREKLKIQS